MQQSVLLMQQTCNCSGAFGSRRPTRSQQRQVLHAASARCQDQQCSTIPSSSSSSLLVPGRLMLGAAAAATVLQLSLPALAALPDAAAAASSSSSSRTQQQQPWQPVLGDMSLTAAAAAPAVADDADDELMDELTAQVAMPEELLRFMELTQKGEVKDVRRLQEARRAVGFERSLDGRVFLLTEDGEPFQVKNDMGVPGLLLLRDAGGYCYFIPPPEQNRLVQIDLSDDAIVAQLFANHAWEELVEPLEVLEGAPGPAGDVTNQGGGARLQQLRLTERQFRSVVSLAAGAQELPEEPLEDLDAQEQQRP